MTWIPNRW